MMYRNGTRWKISLFLIYIRSTSVLYFHGIFIFWISISDVCGCPFSSILYSSISGYGSLGFGIFVLIRTNPSMPPK